MNLEEIEQKQKDLESDTAKYRHDRVQRAFEIAKAYEDLGEKERAEHARMEAVALNLPHHGGQFPGYFQPVLVLTDGRVDPPLEYFTDDRLRYYSERARQTGNCIHAARFADIAWDFSQKNNGVRLPRLEVSGQHRLKFG